MQLLLWAVAIVLMLIGLAGVIVPILPGAVLVFAGMVVGAWADGFENVGWKTLTALGLLALASYLLDFIAGLVGVRKLGASRRAVWGAGIGTVVGLFFGLPGLLLGPFVGAVVGELTLRRRLKEAGRAGAGAWIGIVLGAAVKVALIALMVGLFVAAFVV